MQMDMTNNLFLGPDAQARFLMQNLMAHDGKGEITRTETHVIDGVHLSNDPEADITGTYESRPGELLRLKAVPRGDARPRWQALHVAMGPADLSGAGVLGVVIRSRAPASITTRVCLRSGRDGAFVDNFFAKSMISFAQESTHLDVIDLARTPDLPRSAQWRDLVLFFRAGEVELELLDLRLFIV